ncbi:MAG TPA: ankyrin repeat domain-containing protein [Bryobacteraceae bacterium]|nr:ankyrin repeat domain-containing protein [Bryobacteraceae bacterium]
MKPLLILAASAGLLCAQIATTEVSAPQITSMQMLRRAEMMGDLKTVENLLASGFDANTSDRLGQTPLLFGMTLGRPGVVELLLAYHADPNAPMTGANPHSLTPLQYAADRGDLVIARSLIAAGARVNDKGGSGRTPLHYALTSHLDVMRLLIEKGADVNIRDSEGASPLDDAVWRGNLDAAAIVLAHGARLNEPDTQTGATPVNEAAFRGHMEVVRYLLQLHPDVTIADNRGYTPLQNAIRTGREDAALLLLDAQPPAQRTMQFFGKTMEAAVGKDQALVAEAVLRQGMTANEVLPSGYTPLDAAAFGGAPKVARMLLDHGADPNAAGKDGTAPLEDAAGKGFDSMADTLLTHGARVNQGNTSTGATALYAAASSGHLSTVKLLLDRGANASACGGNRKTPYQTAIENGHADIAAEIKSRGGSDRCR